MIKKIFLALFLAAFLNITAQHTIKGQMKPTKDYTWLILYKLNGLNQIFVENTTIKNGAFKLVMPANSEAGMYRILYDNKKNKFIDFIYNDEDVTMEFHPDYPIKLVTYSKSSENKILENYFDAINPIQNEIDKIQVASFKSTNKKNSKSLKKKYKKALKRFKKTQKKFKKKANGKIAKTFILANNNYYPKKIITDVDIYLKNLKLHFFDYVDFNNKHLKKSSILINKIVEYVMFLNTSSDMDLELKLRKKAVDNALLKIKNKTVKLSLTKSLLYSFASTENIRLVNYVFDNHYNKYKTSKQDDAEFKSIIGNMLKITIGNTARNIVWEENGTIKDLYSLTGSKYYLLTFWHSTCGHCLRELPKLKNFLKNNKELNLKVVAVALEEEDSKVKWKEETYFYEDFIHVLAMGEKQAKYVTDYDITETPNFFLLNSKKQIIAKPYDIKALEKIFSKNEKAKE